jgi:hypothetical protein
MACEFGVLAVLGRRFGRDVQAGGRPPPAQASGKRRAGYLRCDAEHSGIAISVARGPSDPAAFHIPQSERVPLVSQAAGAGFNEYKIK